MRVENYVVEEVLQKTLKSHAVFSGVGLHSGRDVTVTVHPASVETGIWFSRADLSGCDTLISANWQFVVNSALCTRLVNADGVDVSTVEHIMAALAGCGISNAIVELNGPEVPIMDGSALQFVRGFLDAGLIQQAAPVRAIEILKLVEVFENGASALLEPAPGLEIEFAIDFPDAAIGQQSKTLNLANGSFVHELCDSRTFCSKGDVATMRSNGLALGGTLLNAVVVEGTDVLSPGGMRHHDEPVRHKMLDAVGDLALAGGPILGRYIGNRAGHTITNMLLRRLFSQPGSFQMINCSAQTAKRLPGASVALEI